jgi:tripartite ATP-independent transporter DctP family solute receptor
MLNRPLGRRAFLAGVTGLGGSAAVASFVPFVRALQTEFTFTQFHNQPANSTLHRRLVDMWQAVAKDTRGRVETRVRAENDHIAGSDPAALDMLMSGEIQFFTLMGGILGNVVPAAQIQQVPFSFRSPDAAFRALDGPLGAYLRKEIAAKGIVALPVTVFDNGMRQIASSTRPIVMASDLEGFRIRVPDGQMFSDTFRALGAQPVTINVNGIYDALKSRRVDAQENPLAVVELFKLYDVVKYVSMTNHMWSGFNLLIHGPTWQRLPTGIRKSVERHAATFIRLQREDQSKINRALTDQLAMRGLVFNAVDPSSFRARLSSVYSKWRKHLGEKCWSLLEAETGPLK